MSTVENSTGVPAMITPESHPLRFNQIMDGIARTKKMMILWGDIASNEHGLPALGDSTEVDYGDQGVRRVPLRTLMQDLKPTQSMPAESHNPFVVASYNLIMATRRVSSRSAAVGQFSTHMSAINRTGKLVLGMSTSFDGLEGLKDQSLDKKVVMLCGDNRVLNCYGRRCAGLTELQTTALDATLLSMADVEGKVRRCDVCYAKYIKESKKKRYGSERTYLLRPAIDNDLLDSMVAGAGRTRMLRAARRCQLLLILGTSFKSQSLRELTQDLADIIHKESGAVVYVGIDRLKGRNMYSHIDFHLGGDPVDLMGRILEDIKQPVASVSDDLMPVYNEMDFWSDMISNEVAVEQRAREEILDDDPCVRCGCSIGEYLTKCIGCDTSYCFRRINFDESDEALGQDGHITPIDMPDPQGQDPFWNEEACLVLNYFSLNGKRPSLDEAQKGFLCPDCWDRPSQGMYPHFVKQYSRAEAGTEGLDVPKLAVAIYYVEQFWPHTLHLATMIAARSSNKGWKCIVQPIKLEQLEEIRPFENFSFEPKTYHLTMIYLTHGLSDDQGYQLAHQKALKPAQFLEQTIETVKHVAEQASTRRALLMCCGHPLHHSGLVQSLQQWIGSTGAFDSILGCMNTRLAPAYIVNLAAKLTTRLFDTGPKAAEKIMRLWSADSMAFSHTNMLFLAPLIQPQLWLYAPMQSRPLGRPLPNLLSVCSCPDRPVGEQKLRRGGGRKVWDVRHTNAKDNMPLRDVQVRATCLVCKQTWPLPAEHMVGILRKYLGSFIAVVPYFPDPVSE